MVDTTALIKIASEAAGILNKTLDQLPTHEQRQVKQFFKLLDTYQQEISRKDKDFDYLLTLRERSNLMLQTVLRELKK